MDATLATLPLETLQTRLTEAHDALHKLMIGKGVVSVNLGDRRVQYSEREVSQLRIYIGELSAAIAAKTTPGRPMRGPIYVN